MLKYGIDSEVNRCILCYDAPCTKYCDKKIETDKIIRSLYFENEYGVVDDLKSYPCENCDAPCEKKCVLNKYNNPIKIKSILAAANDIRNEKIKDMKNDDVDISMDICGVKIENPFLLSSSVVASNYEMIDKAFSIGFAGVSFKTICNFPQHETSPRFSALKSHSGHFYGFKNIEQLSDHAVEENMEIFKRLKEKYPSKVIVASIMGRNEKEWEDLSKICSESGADVIELNFSCPNMEDGDLGVAIGQSEELIEKFTRAARNGTKKPILAKLTPNVTDMVPFAIAAKRAGADGISAINTIRSITGVNVDTFVPEPAVHGSSALGGYSGRAVKPIGLRFIAEMQENEELKKMHFSAMGGIENYIDALEYILLGAGSLQLTTSVMQYGYRIVEDLISGITGYMKERNIKSVKDLIGAAIENVVDLNKLERDTILFPRFNLDTCVGCGRCYVSCFDGGHQAIDFIDGKPKLLGNKCVGCHLCKLVCPTGAITTMNKRINK